MDEKLKKARIRVFIPEKKDDPGFDVLFNPNEYRLSKANQFAEVAIPGLRAPLLQFGHGNAQTLTMQLFFDTYDPASPDQKSSKNTDVRLFTQKVTDLLQINSELHAPPVCQFSWGNLSFIGVLQQADVHYTLFLPSGIPVRATVDVTFKQYFDGALDTGLFDQAPDTQSANFQKRYVVQRGDTLSSIAGEVYNDPTNWRPIASANGLDNPLAIRPGQVLSIPAIE